MSRFQEIQQEIQRPIDMELSQRERLRTSLEARYATMEDSEARDRLHVLMRNSGFEPLKQPHDNIIFVSAVDQYGAVTPERENLYDDKGNILCIQAPALPK